MVGGGTGLFALVRMVPPSRGSIGLAPPVAYLAPLNLTLQEEVRGERLGALTTDKGFTRMQAQ